MPTPKYLTIIQICDKNGKFLRKASEKEIKNDIIISDGVINMNFHPYILKNKHQFESLANKVHSTNIKLIYEPYPLDVFISDVSRIMENDDYITAIKTIMKNKNIILVKHE